MTRLASLCLLLLAASPAGPAWAQGTPKPDAPPINAIPGPPLGGSRVPPGALQHEVGTLSLTATLGQSQALRSGLVWRIYRDTGSELPAQLVQQSTAANPTFPLEPGVYVVHAGYGLAGATKRIVMGAVPIAETIQINAGGLVLGGIIGDTPIPPDKLRFNIYVPIGNDPEGRLVLEDAKAATLVRLPEGTYRVVSTYGESNAIMSADLRVEVGQVTQAVVRHRAATVTLKLVGAPGTEALANTTFSVLTPGGDTIREAIGAFPSMTLAEGEYVVIARNGGKVYTLDFTVKSGLDRDVEVLAREQSGGGQSADAPEQAPPAAAPAPGLAPP